MGRLAGKVAIVTGGARGMGEATSRLFAAEGARVLIADVLDREGEALAGAIGSAALFRHHDVTDEASWEAVTTDAVRQFGGVDVLVNNAGVLLFKALTETTKAEFERVIGVNLVGTFLGMKIVAPSRSDTVTVDEEARTSAGTPWACMLQITQAVNARPAVTQTILMRRRTAFQFTADFVTDPCVVKIRLVSKCPGTSGSIGSRPTSAR